MDIPEKTRKQYADQAKAVPYSLLLSWLNIGSQCDIHYKASKNQRLLVELALMKMAHVNSAIKLQPGTAEADPGKKKVK
jgi:DNA polymerase-3 subunit gamma/tau